MVQIVHAILLSLLVAFPAFAGPLAAIGAGGGAAAPCAYSNYGTPYLWLDLSDNTTVLNGSAAPAADNEKIDQVTDKTGNSRNAKMTVDGQRPTYKTAAQNSLNVAEFSGTSQWMTILNSTGIGRNITGISVLFVYKMIGSDTQGGLFQFEDNANGDRGMGYYESTWALGMQRVDGAGTDYRESGSADAGNTWYIGVWVLDYGNATGNIWISGVNKLAATGVSSAGTTSNTNSSSAPVIAVGSSGGAYDAHIQWAEMWVTQGALSTANRDGLEACASTKWNIPVS